MLGELLTKKYTRVPLLTIYFNLPKYKMHGAKDSCAAIIHPEIANDEYIKATLNTVIDYIRDNYDMEKLAKL